MASNSAGRSFELSRRQALRFGLAGSAALLLPLGLLSCGDDDASLAGLPPPSPTATPTPQQFLTGSERDTLRALVGRIVPTDSGAGAIECGANDYIDRLLTLLPDAIDNKAGVYAGGPFSGRAPYPDPHNGTASDRFPPNDFVNFIPLNRLQLLSWRAHLLGSAAVPGAGFNDAVLGPRVGLRDRYRNGIKLLNDASQNMFGKTFAALDATQQDEVIDVADEQFVDLLTGHTLEGMFCAPEYGGNHNLAGWNLIHYDGDSQPLGYAIYDETAGVYRERSDKPLSTTNPGEDFAGVSAETQQFLRFLVRIVGGPHFP